MKFKEAFVEILLHHIKTSNETCEQFCFFDLCAGSGQIGIEALSLDFKFVHFSDLAPMRLKLINEFIKLKLSPYHIAIMSSYLIHRKSFLKMIKYITDEKKSILYFDLPYDFWNVDQLQILDTFWDHLFSHLKMNLTLWAFIQGPMPYTKITKYKNQIISGYEIEIQEFEPRYYGRQVLSFFSITTSNIEKQI